MLGSVLLALTLATNISGGDSIVGPIHLGERVVDVQKELGPGWRGPVVDSLGNKSMALVYTDGVDQLQVWIQSDPDLGETVDGIVARENRPEGCSFAHRTVLRSWRWAGGTIFEMPRELAGWKVMLFSPPRRDDGQIASYEHPDGWVVWFTRNAWGGVDSHTFAD